MVSIALGMQCTPLALFKTPRCILVLIDVYLEGKESVLLPAPVCDQSALARQLGQSVRVF